MRVNDQIDTSPVRLIDEDGNQIGIVPLNKAFEVTLETGLDLVEVSPNAKPPVCRIMNYGKFRYELSKKAKQAKKHRHVSQVKEIKLRSEISDHDFNFKIRHAIEFLKRGDKVKFTLVFKGREILHKDIGEAVLKRVMESIEDYATVEIPMRLEGNNFTMVLMSKRSDDD